ncbi:MAG: hypothetical protein Q8R48_04135, partial [Candidatus Omnitrophota bacterium]|nr:hypothetical protein [Candidatus Omnitrophota bacterium]
MVQAKKRLTAPIERGSGWLRIAATPHEAYAFHKGWVSDVSGEYAARLGDETYIFPIRIWEKMVAWSKKSKDLERSGIFSIRQTSPHIYEAMDFIPLGSLAYDPSIRNEEVSDVYATQGTDFLFDNLLEASTIEALGIDLELQWRLISEESSGNIIISAHSHHRNAYYRDSPSKPDQKDVGKEGIAFVYCNAVKKGFIYNEDTVVEVEQKLYLRASGSSRDSASGKGGSEGKIEPSPISLKDAQEKLTVKTLPRVNKDGEAGVPPDDSETTPESASGTDKKETSPDLARRSSRGTKWSPEIIIKKIKRLHREKVDLNSVAICNSYLALHAAARYRFGSWGKAIQAAGLDYEEIKRPLGRKAERPAESAGINAKKAKETSDKLINLLKQRDWRNAIPLL